MDAVASVVGASIAGTDGVGVALAFDVLILLVLAMVYGARTCWIRFAHQRERGCANPLHREQASSRAAVAQTALTLGAGVCGVLGLPVPWLAPVWLLDGWAGLTAGALVGVAVAVGTGRWRAQRERALGFTEQGCWL